MIKVLTSKEIDSLGSFESRSVFQPPEGSFRTGTGYRRNGGIELSAAAGWVRFRVHLADGLRQSAHPGEPGFPVSRSVRPIRRLVGPWGCPQVVLPRRWHPGHCPVKLFT